MTTPAHDQRLEHLLRTAARVFADRGYHATTMRYLARASGMSLAGMYYYVPGKDELLFLIQDRCFRAVLAGAEEAVAEGADPADRIARFIRHHVAFFAAHLNEMRVLSQEADSLTGPHRDHINRLKRRYVDLLAGLIAQLAGEGDRRARLSAYALFGMMNWMYTWYHPRGPVSPEELAAHFARLFLEGAAPERAIPALAPVAEGGERA